MVSYTRKFLCYLSLVLILGGFTFLFLNPLKVSATPTPLHQFDSNSIPAGIPGDMLINPADNKPDTLFRPLTYLTTVGNLVGNSNYFPNGIKNNVSPVNNGFTTAVANHGGGYIALWNASATAGVLWSNDKYKMDLDKDQYFSFWFWNQDTNLSTFRSTGGFTFAIQNDSRQQNAYSYNNSGGTITSAANMGFAPDETLGIYAADQNSPHLSNAVLNSWALSVDSYPNTSGKINDSFDQGVYQGVPSLGNVYLSTGYPGDSSTYVPIVGNDGTTHYTIPRTTVDRTNMSFEGNHGMWHHLRILYQAPTDGGDDAHMTYWFNDIFEDGSSNTNTTTDSQTDPKLIERKVPVDLSKLHVTKDSSGKRLVRWGLTYKNDSKQGNESMVVENASPVMNISSGAEVIDVTQDNRVLTPENKYVNSDDKLILRYSLKYNRGVTDWSAIKSITSVPKGFNVNKTDYGSVTYASGAPINITNPTVSDGYLQYQLSKNLSATDSSTSSPKAVMDINGTAQAADNTDLAVNGIENYFNGSYYIERVPAQSFIVRGKRTKSLQLTSNSSSPIKTFPGGNISVNGALHYGDNSAFVNPGAEVYLNVNGTNKDPINVALKNSGDTSIDISDAISKELTSELGAGDLKSGDNTVTIYSRDSFGNKSNTLTFTINVSDKSVSLDLDSNGYSFADIQDSYKGLVQRKGNWKVNVDSVNSTWSLSASASTMTDIDSEKQTHTFNGGLVYKNGQTVDAMNHLVQIGQSGSTDETAITKIGENWPTDGGVLLESDGNENTKGKYTGTISWDLIQGP